MPKWGRVCTVFRVDAFKVCVRERSSRSSDPASLPEDNLKQARIFPYIYHTSSKKVLWNQLEFQDVKGEILLLTFRRSANTVWPEEESFEFRLQNAVKHGCFLAIRSSALNWKALNRSVKVLQKRQFFSWTILLDAVSLHFTVCLFAILHRVGHWIRWKIFAIDKRWLHSQTTTVGRHRCLLDIVSFGPLANQAGCLKRNATDK